MSAEDENQPLLPDAETKKAVFDDYASINQNEEEEEETFRHKTYVFLTQGTTGGAYFEIFIFLLIFLNVGAFLVSTIPGMQAAHAQLFRTIEVVSVLIFTVEYILRTWSIVEDPYYSKVGVWAGRRLYMTSFFALVDFCAIVPFYIDLLLPGDTIIPTQFIRLLRLFRLFNAGGPYFEAFTIFSAVFSSKKSLFVLFTYAAFVVWIIMSTIYWVVERNNPRVPPGAFSSIWSSMWWNVMNLSGEFPLNGELTTWGKFLAVVNMLLAIGGIFGIVAGVLGDGFQDQIAERREQHQKDAIEREREENEALKREEQAAAELLGEPPKAEPEEDKEDLTVGTELCKDCAELQRAQEESVAGFRRKLFWFLAAKTTAGKVFEIFIFALIFANVIGFAIQTIPGYGNSQFADIFEAVSVIIFTIEYILRVYASVEDERFQENDDVEWWDQGRFKYVRSFFALVDLVAIAPWYIDHLGPGRSVFPTTFVRALRLLRLLKADSYVGAFTMLYRVFASTKELFFVTGFVVLVMWVFLSSLMYYSERYSGLEVQDEFVSVPKAMWLTLLNLSGEFPTGAYSTKGQFIGVFMAVLAAGVFGVPVGILSGGFEELMEEKQEEEDKRLEAFENLNCPQCNRPYKEVDQAGYEAAQAVVKSRDAKEEIVAQYDDSTRTQLFRFFNGLTPWGGRFEGFIFFLIGLNVFCFIIDSDPAIVKQFPWFEEAYFWVELVSVVIFTIEYLFRLYAAPSDPALADSSFPRIRHLFSFFSIIDLLAILPFYIDLALPNLDIIPTTMLRIFRLVRVLKSEEYAPVVGLLDDVFRAKKFILIMTIWVALVCVVLFSFILHYTELNNNVMVDELTMAERFVSVPSSLWYVFLHMTGDYPLFQYCDLSRVFHFVMIVLAAGLMGIPIGVIQQGFQEKILEDREKKERARAEEEYKKLFRQYDKDNSGKISADELKEVFEKLGQDVVLSKQRVENMIKEADTDGDGEIDMAEFTVMLAKRVKGVQRQNILETIENWRGEEEPQEEQKRAPRYLDEKHCRKCRNKLADEHGARAQLHAFFVGDTAAGRYYAYFILTVIFVNMFAFLCDTSASIRRYGGGMFVPWFFYIEYGAVFIYTLEYMLRLFAAAEDEDFGKSRWRYATSFFALVDLMAFLPFYIGLIVHATGDLAIFLKVLRVIRMFKTEHYIEAFTVFDNVYSRQRAYIVVTLFVSLLLWIIFGTLFYFSEAHNPDVENGFRTIPMSMFFTMLFLGGEWARCDLTIPGRVVGFFLALVAMGVFSLPAGFIMDGFQGLVEEREEQEERPEFLCQTCGKKIKNFIHHRLEDE